MAEQFDIEKFKSIMTGGGARPTLFEVTVTDTTWAGAGAVEKMEFTCKAANLPQVTLGTIELGYFGRKVKVPGDKSYDAWTVTILNDEDFVVRRWFERWHNAMQDARTIKRNDQATASLASYKRDAYIKQFKKEGQEVLKAYKFIGLYPSVLGAIEVSHDTQNTIEEFQVTFEYDYWVDEPAVR